MRSYDHLVQLKPEWEACHMKVANSPNNSSIIQRIN